MFIKRSNVFYTRDASITIYKCKSRFAFFISNLLHSIAYCVVLHLCAVQRWNHHRLATVRFGSRLFETSNLRGSWRYKINTDVSIVDRGAF